MQQGGSKGRPCYLFLFLLATYFRKYTIPLAISQTKIVIIQRLKEKAARLGGLS